MTVEVESISTWPQGNLLSSIRDALGNAEQALVATAFIDPRGVLLLERELKALGPRCRLLVTSVFDRQRTSAALSLTHSFGVETKVLNWRGGTFHPKIYLTQTGTSSQAVVGSSNLTSGLVTNVEVATALTGQRHDRALASLWETTEGLWCHERSVPWAPSGDEGHDEFEPDLWSLLERSVHEGQTVFTLSDDKPNRITSITRAGLWVETDKSAEHNRSELVPPRMIQVAWDSLQANGELTNKSLEKNLRVHRSSFVCALLGHLPGVVVASRRPIRLTFAGVGQESSDHEVKG